MKLTHGRGFVIVTIHLIFGTATIAQIPQAVEVAKAMDAAGKAGGVVALYAFMTTAMMCFAWWLTFMVFKTNAKVISSLIKIGTNLEIIAKDLSSRPCHMPAYKKMPTPNPLESMAKISEDTPA